MQNLKEIITTSRDYLGVSALLLACVNAGIIDKLYEIGSRRCFTLLQISNATGIDSYFLAPIFEMMEKVGILAKEKDCYNFIDIQQFTYYRKMMNVLPLYLELQHYISKARGEYTQASFHFNKLITSTSSRLSAPAVQSIIKKYPAYIKNRVKVLDIGCGTGDYLIALAESNPNLSGIGIEMDEKVADTAGTAVAKRNLQQRISIMNADFLNECYGLTEESCDFIMMNHIYHVAGEELSEKLTKKSYCHLKEGGLFFNLEICKDFPSKKEIIPTLFDCLMRFYYPENKGKAFTKTEIEKIMTDAGYWVNDKNHIVIENFDTPNMVYFVGTK